MAQVDVIAQELARARIEASLSSAAPDVVSQEVAAVTDTPASEGDTGVAVDDVAGALVDDDVLHPADLVEDGR